MKKPNVEAVYHQLNGSFFGGTLPSLPIVWNGRLSKSAGMFYYKESLKDGKVWVVPTRIGLSTKIFEAEGFDMAKIKSTLLHEMIHVAEAFHHNAVPSHGRLFRTYLEAINNKIKREDCPIMVVGVCHSFKVAGRSQ